MADIVYTNTQALPPGFLGVPYEVAIGIRGMASVLTATGLNSGSLPPGLSIAAANDLRLVGTPTQAGVFTFKFTATDSAGAAVSPTLTLTIYDAPGDEKLTADFATPTAVASHRRLN